MSLVSRVEEVESVERDYRRRASGLGRSYLAGTISGSTGNGNHFQTGIAAIVTCSRLSLDPSSHQVVEILLLFRREKFIDFRLHTRVGYDGFRQQSRLCIG
jgi:hypothetical protein